ncbi:MAG: hypothetical protein EOO29_29070, partial [Comamonadaceae bacterium]
MSLPTQVIDRLFTRLAATYGAAWDRSVGQAPINDVKSAWAHELQGFSSQLEAVAWGLENLPEQVPNVIQFRNLCRRAPAPDVPRLPEPPPNVERVREELAKLGAVRQQLTAGARRDTEWAHRIVGRSKA